MIIPKRTIDELKVRLRLEKSVREIYVEGTFDRDMYRWILNQLNLTDVRVYPISTLDVPSDLLREFGLTSGERQRLIATAQALKDEEKLHEQVIFIIDSDLDYLLGIASYDPPLLGTAGTSTELILWRKEVLLKFFSMALGCDEPEKSLEQIQEFVEVIVADICLFRAAKQLLDKDWKLIDISDLINKHTPFSFKNYCEKIADKNGVRKEMESSLPKALEEIKVRAEKLEVSKKLHGHDLIAAMGRKLSIDGFKQQCLKDFNELSRLLMASLEWDFVKDDETIALISLRLKK